MSLLLLSSLLSLSSLARVEANLKGQFCTDISTYGPVIYHPGITCNKTLIGEPKIEYKTVKLHITHKETKCETRVVDEVVMEEVTLYPTCIVTEEQWFQEWKSEMVPHNFTHIKHKFECEYRNRSNCETIWETSADGTKTAVQGPCDIVRWKDCWKIPYNATFTTMKSHKIKGELIPYQSCSTMAMPVKQMKWHVKKVLVSVCKIVPVEDWKEVEEKWVTPQLDEPKPGPKFKVPWQERLHREKCLQPGGGGDHHDNDGHHQSAQDKPTPFDSAKLFDLRQGKLRGGRKTAGGRVQKRKSLDFQEALKGLQTSTTDLKNRRSG